MYMKTLPARQRFDTETLPRILDRYDTKVSVKRHYYAAPSTQLSPMLLHGLAVKQGIGSEVAAELMKARLEHKNTLANDARVRTVAQKFNLLDSLAGAMQDQTSAERIRKDWAQAASKVAYLPFVVIEGEIAVDGDEQNLILVLDSLLRVPPTG